MSEGDEQTRREAAFWFARMRASDAQGSRPAFEDWLSESPAHRAAYNRAAEVFAMGKVLRSKEPPAVPLPDKGSNALRLAVPVAGLLLVAGAGWLAFRVAPSPPGTAPVQAFNDGRAQLASTLQSSLKSGRIVRLPDGSTVRLAPASMVRVRFDGRVRHLEVSRGAARFHVAQEPRRFVVAAGSGSVTALGTVFDVAVSSSHQVTVRLIEGIVDVRLPPDHSAPAGNQRRLRAGQVISYPAGQGSSEVPLSPSARGPEKNHDSVPLTLLVQQSNQLSSRPIRIVGDEIGGLKVSGRFRTDDSERLADRLALLFDLEADRTDPSEIRLQRR